MNNFQQISCDNFLTKVAGLINWYIIYDSEKLSFRNWEWNVSEVPEAFIKCYLLCLYQPSLFRESCYESEYNKGPGSNSLQLRKEHIIT